jgi:hypothetical protein
MLDIKWKDNGRHIVMFTMRTFTFPDCTKQIAELKVGFVISQYIRGGGLYFHTIQISNLDAEELLHSSLHKQSNAMNSG